MPTNQLNFDSIIPAVAVGKINHYISIPAFSYDGIIWKGASEIVVQYNYTTTKNFVLKFMPEPPSGVNFVACIRFRIGGNVYRYKLWGDIGEIMPTVPLYAGEIIKKNCVIEIWNIESSTEVSLDDDFVVTTSIRSIPADYSAIADKEDTDASAAVEPLSLVSAMPSAPATTGLAFRYRLQDATLSGAAIDTVPDLSGNSMTMATLVNAPLAATSGSITEANRIYANISAVNKAVGYDGSVAVACKHVFLVFNPDTHSANKIIVKGGGIDMRQVGGGTALMQVRVGAVDTEIEVPTDVTYIIEAKLDYDGADYYTVFNVYDIFGNLLSTATSGAVVTPGSDVDIFIGDAAGASSALMKVLEYFGYTDELSAADLQTTINYIVGYYNNNAILLPNAWTDGSAWLDNP